MNGEWHAFTFVVTEADQTVPTNYQTEYENLREVLGNFSQLELQTCAFEDWGPVQAQQPSRMCMGTGKRR